MQYPLGILSVIQSVIDQLYNCLSGGAPTAPISSWSPSLSSPSTVVDVVEGDVLLGVLLLLERPQGLVLGNVLLVLGTKGKEEVV